MAVKTSLLLVLAFIVSFCIAQDQNVANIYRGTIELLPDGNGNFRNFAQVTIDYDINQVEIIYEGTDNAWNGIGFGQNVMNRSYAIIMDYDQSDPQNPQPIVFETVLGFHNPGNQLVVSNLDTRSDEFDANTIQRRITVTRPIKPANEIGFTFPENPTTSQTITIPIIAAQGPGYQFFISPSNRHSFFDREPSYIYV